MRLRTRILSLSVIALFTFLTAQNKIGAAPDTGVRFNELPNSIDLLVTLNADAPTPKYTLVTVPLKTGWLPTHTGWLVAGNANGGGGGSSIKRSKTVELSDDHYAHESQPPQAVVNNARLREWGAQTKPAVRFDPNQKLTDSQVSDFYHNVLTRGGMMTYKMKDQDTVDSVRVYLPDSVYEGMGKRYSYKQFPEAVKRELNQIRKALEALGLFNDDFWNNNVVADHINFRFLSRADFEKITCEKYVPALKEEIQVDPQDHHQFGCTYADSTYIVNELYNFEISNPRDMAFALLHERLWSLKPGFAERARIPKDQRVFAFVIETDIDERLKPAISLFMFSLRRYIEYNSDVYAAILKNVSTKAFRFQMRP